MSEQGDFNNDSNNDENTAVKKMQQSNDDSERTVTHNSHDSESINMIVEKHQE